MLRLFASASLVMLVCAISATAQRPLDPTQRDSAFGPRRAELERRFHERTAEIVRRRLNLNADQMARLQTVNKSFESQRMSLAMRERETRRALRDELMSGANPNQGKVAGLLDQMLRLQRQRLDLVESEQRELAKFLTPVQRARYFGLQNQMRRRMQELQQRRGTRRGMR